MFSWIPWWVNLDWRMRKRTMLILCAFEFVPTIVALVLFGIADPDTYRTKLWTEGARHGWNSDPIELLYAYANYKPIATPKPWAQFVTDWNVVISVLSTFILIVKVVLYLTHVFPPFFSAIVHGGLTIIWAYSISLQAASDYSDPEHPSRVPWYLTHSCGAPVSTPNQHYCMQAKAAFAVTTVEVALFFTFFVYSVLTSFPNEEQKQEQREREREEQEWKDIENYDDKKFEYELDQMHLPGQQTPGAGFHAYSVQPGKATFGMETHELSTMNNGANVSITATGRPNRDLPLRHHITSDVYA